MMTIVFKTDNEENIKNKGDRGDMSSVVEEGHLLDSSTENVDLDLINEDELLKTPPHEKLNISPTQGTEINSTNGLEIINNEKIQEVDSTTDIVVTSTNKTVNTVIDKNIDVLSESIFKPTTVKVFTMSQSEEEFKNCQISTKLPDNLLFEFNDKKETDESYKCVKSILNSPDLSSFEKLTAISDVSIIPLDDDKTDLVNDKVKWSIMKNKKEMKPKRAVAMLTPKPSQPPCQPDLHPLRILRVPQYGEEKKQSTSLRPTALVNPFPPNPPPDNYIKSTQIEGDVSQPDQFGRVLNGSSTSWKPIETETVKDRRKSSAPKQKPEKNRPTQTSILDYTKPLHQVSKPVIKRRKKALKTVIDQLGAKNLQIIQPDICVTNQLTGTGGNVSIQEKTITDPLVVDRLKRLGTIIELEEEIIKEPNSLALLENMKFDKPQSPIVTALEEVYVNKDISVYTSQKAKSPEPCILEPVIDIVEDVTLSYEGKFIFKMDTFHVDLPNETKVFACDICSAVYHHSHMLKKHYLRLHIARKYIPDREMEIYNIQNEQSEEKDERLIFRCHTCRTCLASKNDLKSHLMDHPPLTELNKQVKSLKSHKCNICNMTFKWRKVFIRHKKVCKPVDSVYNFSDEASNNPTLETCDLYHCLYCNETFKNMNKKRNHVLSNHPYRKNHKCSFCKRSCTSLHNLFTHLIQDHPSKYFACKTCKERFLNLPELKKHTRKKHNLEKDELALLSRRTSNINQDKEHYSCDTCDKLYLIEACFKNHKINCEKDKIKPKIRKSKSFEKTETKIVDPEVMFYSQVSLNVRDNLLHHLDGKLDSDDIENEPEPPSKQFLNYSDGFSLQNLNQNEPEIQRTKAPWEKYSFPKTYDGRCGLTSYIKDMSCLDISTQLIMRKNLQNMEISPSKDNQELDVPSVLALERLGAKCAESYGLKFEDDEGHILGELSGEWVRERVYICSVCKWETPCLWSMEDHKYEVHPGVHCPQHELVGDQKMLSNTIYQRLIGTECEFEGSRLPTPPPIESVKCTKCDATGFPSRGDLHVHILACAGVVVQPWLPTPKKKKWKKKRRGRRGLKRNIPSTPHRPVKMRTKPGDTDTIQKMIANLPAKRSTRRVIGFDENDLKTRSQSTIQNVPQQVQRIPKKKTNPKGKEDKKEHNMPLKETDLIDTSAERGDVLSSLRMMPVSTPREELLEPRQILDKVLGVTRDENIGLPCTGCGQTYDNKILLRKHHKTCAYYRECGPNSEHKCKTCSQIFDFLLALIEHNCDDMPKLEIQKDILPVNNGEIPILSPEKKIKYDDDPDLICGISFVDGLIKYETLSSISQETDVSDDSGKSKKRKISNNETNKRKRQRRKYESDTSGPVRRSQVDKVLIEPEEIEKKSKKKEIDVESKKEIQEIEESIEVPEFIKESEVLEDIQVPERIEVPELIEESIEVSAEPKTEVESKDIEIKNETNKENIDNVKVNPERRRRKSKAKAWSRKKRKNNEPSGDGGKKRGRPFGTKKHQKEEIPERRSARFLKPEPPPPPPTPPPIPPPPLIPPQINKEDEIVPFEESPPPKKPPSPKLKRKPRKREETPDKTTIVVQVEVHPEPPPRPEEPKLEIEEEPKKLKKKKKIKKKKRKLPKGQVLTMSGFSWEVSELDQSPPKPEQTQDWEGWQNHNQVPLPLPAPIGIDQPTPSLGTIIDSVNKLLNEPESTYVPYVPQYTLADLQRAMGASDAEMAVLQQLGEATCIEEEDKTVYAPKEDWNEDIIDLDNQPQQPVVSSSVETPVVKEEPAIVTPVAPPTSFYKPRIFLRDDKNTFGRSPPSPRLSSSTSLLAAYNGKEVVCPTCSSHFMGFEALQKHVNTVHASQETQVTAALTRRVVLNSMGSRLVCFECLQILPSNIMSNHLEDDHGLDPSDITKCSTVSGETNNGTVGGERLKNKMSSALGDLLDKAVNNLLTAKAKSESPLTGSAVELLTRLCTVRRRESTIKHNSRELFMRLKMSDVKPEDDSKPSTPRPYSCTICGQKFSLASSRNKHEVLAHRTYRQHEDLSTSYNEFDDFDNDWREAPSPTGSVEGNIEQEWKPQCSDCGLSFPSLHEMMKHRLEDHRKNRRSSTENSLPVIKPASNLIDKNVQPQRVMERSASLDAQSPRPAKVKKQRPPKKTTIVGPALRARAEAALRQLNIPRKKPIIVHPTSPQDF